MPSMRAPICISSRARSWTCGSEAALWITVEPGVSAAAISAFSVAMTDGSSMKKSQARRPVAARRAGRRALDAHLGAEGAEGVEVRVEAAAADHVAAGRRHVGAAEAGQQRPGAAGTRRGCARRSSASTVACGSTSSARERDHVLVAPLGLHAEVARAARPSPPRRGCAGRCAARPPRSVSSAGGERGQRGVLVAGGDDRAGEGRAAFDDELLHARIRRGRARAAGKGIEGHLTHGSAPRPDTLPRMAAAVRAKRPGSWSCEWTESESLRKHMLGVEAAMAPTRASAARTRSCRPSPASSTTSTTSATRTSTPATRARRSSCSSSGATRRS